MRRRRRAFINSKEYYLHAMCVSRQGKLTFDLAQTIYDNLGDNQLKPYLRWLEVYVPLHTADYYRKLYDIYRYFVIQNKIKPSALYHMSITDLYIIKTTRKGIYTKALITAVIEFFKRYSNNNKQRKSYLWELRNKRIFLLESISVVQKRYDVDAVEKFCQIYGVSETDTDNGV